jgi:hypothetical protein
MIDMGNNTKISDIINQSKLLQNVKTLILITCRHHAWLIHTFPRQRSTPKFSTHFLTDKLKRIVSEKLVLIWE